MSECIVLTKEPVASTSLTCNIFTIILYFMDTDDTVYTLIEQVDSAVTSLTYAYIPAVSYSNLSRGTRIPKYLLQFLGVLYNVKSRHMWGSCLSVCVALTMQ
jgi:hypothetical protein